MYLKPYTLYGISLPQNYCLEGFAQNYCLEGFSNRDLLGSFASERRKRRLSAVFWNASNFLECS